ncbi:MAG: lytic transglycosylase domain-containing protein [Eubacterium sp.]|nr:lytic transglycosylase domain-containing protein [Eubacterium sp.]
MNVNSVVNADGIFLPAGADNSTDTVSNYFSNYMNQQNNGSYLEQIFQKAADTYQVSKDLLKAMAKAESNFRADATSHCGAMGIMQLMPATAASLGVTDAYDPEQNIMGGAQYISRLLEKYNGNLAFAVAAYNAGSGNVDKYGGIPPFKETQGYVAKVLGYLQEGVTIPDSASQTAGTSTASSWTSQTQGTYTGLPAAQANATGNVLQNILNQYFDYDDYLEFLQLFTKVIYEKLTGEELDKEEDSVSGQQESTGQAAVQAPQQVQEAAQAEPAKILTLKVKDAQGRINTYQQDDTAGDAYKAFQYMTAGGQNRMSIFLNKTV